MLREKFKGHQSTRTKVSMESTGAEWPVVTLRCAKVHGVKGPHYLAGFVDQLEIGGVHGKGKAI
jgi:hypothetical protein